MKTIIAPRSRREHGARLSRIKAEKCPWCVAASCAASSVCENVDERRIAICRSVEKSRDVITKCASRPIYVCPDILPKIDRFLIRCETEKYKTFIHRKDDGEQKSNVALISWMLRRR